MDGGRIDILKYLDGVDLSHIFGEFKENCCVQNNIKSDTRTCMHSNLAVVNDCKFTIIQNLTINKRHLKLNLIFIIEFWLILSCYLF